MIKRIRALAAALRRKQPTKQLDAADIAALRELTSQPEWQTYQRLLESLVEVFGESMLTTEDPAKLHYLRGLIVGLRESTLYPERLAAQHLNGRRNNDHNRDDDQLDRRRSSLYATSAWPASDG